LRQGGPALSDPAAETPLAGLRPASDAASARATRAERRRPLSRALTIADVVGVLAAATAAAAIGAARDTTDAHALGIYALVLVPAWLGLAGLRGFYRHGERRADGPVTDGLLSFFDVAAVAAWLSFVPFAAVPSWHISIVAPFVFWALAPPLALLSQLVVRRAITADAARTQRVVIVGAGQVGELLARKIDAHPELGLRVVGFVDANPRRPRMRRDDETDLSIPVLGAAEHLEELVDAYDVDRVILAFSLDGHERQLAAVRRLANKGLAVDLVPRLFEVIGSGVNVWAIEGVPLFGLPPLRLSRGSLQAKRAFDVLASAVLLFLLVPVFVLIALCVRLESTGPVFFRQERIGENSRPFTIFKFRSMYATADELKQQVAHLNVYASRGDPRMFKVQNDPRVTRFGRYIRRYFLDELPQLLNVLKGDMSLVGPRPLIPEEDRHVVDWQRSRLALKPGITGPWQVLGGNDIPFDEMVKLDYLYVTGWTLGTDIRLLLQTWSAVARRRVHL
jgi:exopolysaccharide biosynthesis polyprenyl glycosylphosphotransferase